MGGGAMRRTSAIAIATAVLALVTAGGSASAAPGDTLNGGCGFNTDENALLTGGQNVGVIYDLSLSRDASGLPSGATVSCWIEVNGFEAPGTRITTTGRGVQEAESLISFTSEDVDFVNECQSVTFL